VPKKKKDTAVKTKAQMEIIERIKKRRMEHNAGLSPSENVRVYLQIKYSSFYFHGRLKKCFH